VNKQINLSKKLMKNAETYEAPLLFLWRPRKQHKVRRLPGAHQAENGPKKLRCLETLAEQYCYAVKNEPDKMLVVIYTPTEQESAATPALPTGLV
jgi:hypothetical protein